MPNNTSKPSNRPATSRPPSGLAPGTGFSVLFGAFLGLALLKFGNPVILDRTIERPRELWEFLYAPWPLVWGWLPLAALAICALAVARFEAPRPKWIPGLLLFWFFWQLCASAQTVDPQLTRITLIHFGTCLVCFGIGWFALGRTGSLVAFCGGLMPFFIWMLWTGFDQHYGGLEATERQIRETPGWEQQYPPEFLARIAKRRIFATLVYPNALAGVILLLLPLVLVGGWRLSARLTPVSRTVVVGTAAYAGLACLYWSGSKSGWLVAVGLLAVVLLHRPFPRKAKIIAVAAVFLAGMVAFGVKFAPYFREGAASLGARFTYWSAAWQTAVEHPVLGTGPGTFGRVYARIKPPDAEMARLVHNDYLEQASDSGAPGLISYAGFWAALMIWLWRRGSATASELHFACWLGLLGWCVQGFSEFSLYIPALSWPAFTMAGWLWAQEMASTARSASHTFAATQ